MKKHIPNFVTCLNLSSGVCATVVALNSTLPLYYASFFIVLGAIFDFFDGMTARLLGVSSPIGKELDSLADVVTFGIAPSMIVLRLIMSACGYSEIDPSQITSATDWILLLVPLLMVAFSALRLAKFNIDTRQTESFIGLPTPANALLVGALPMALAFQPETQLAGLSQNLYFLVILTIVESYLLVAELPMFSFKFKNLSWAKNKLRFIFIAIAIVLAILFREVAFFYIIVMFILISIINNLISNKSAE